MGIMANAKDCMGSEIVGRSMLDFHRKTGNLKTGAFFREKLS
jgi:hypothetical protein